MVKPMQFVQKGVVLHADVDAFFCQVEALRRSDESLRGVPLAVQQHQDIIAVDYAARQAGVRKHMVPTEARRLLAAVGGRVVHVYCEDGSRPSYRPYRETSAAFMRLLRRLLPPGAVLEAASIDEAFILVPSVPRPERPTGPCDPACATTTTTTTTAAVEALAADPRVGPAWRLAEGIRREALAALGLTVSVGIAPNKLLAKLASRAAKPDGVRVLAAAEAAGSTEVEELLRRTPVSHLPGMGGRVADALAAAGYDTAAQVRQLTVPELVSRFGLRPAVAHLLASWAGGEDPRPVQERGPAKAIQVQMTLTPVPRPAPPGMAARAVNGTVNSGSGSPPSRPTLTPRHSEGGTAAAAAATAMYNAGAAAAAAAAVAGLPLGGMLMPLFPATTEGRDRLARLVRSMAGDIVARVLLDRHMESRWPTKLTVQLVTHGSEGRTASRTCAFPAASLAASSAALTANQFPAAAAGEAGSGSPAGGSHGQRAEAVAAGAAAGLGPPSGVAAGAAAAAAVPAGGGGSQLLVGEHTFFRPGASGALLDAVAGNAMAQCGALLAGCPTGRPLVQVHLTAHSFAPYSSATAAGAISAFLSGAAGPSRLALSGPNSSPRTAIAAGPSRLALSGPNSGPRTAAAAGGVDAAGQAQHVHKHPSAAAATTTTLVGAKRRAPEDEGPGSLPGDAPQPPPASRRRLGDVQRTGGGAVDGAGNGTAAGGQGDGAGGQGDGAGGQGDGAGGRGTAHEGGGHAGPIVARDGGGGGSGGGLSLAGRRNAGGDISDGDGGHHTAGCGPDEPPCVVPRSRTGTGASRGTGAGATALPPSPPVRPSVIPAAAAAAAAAPASVRVAATARNPPLAAQRPPRAAFKGLPQQIDLLGLVRDLWPLQPQAGAGAAAGGGAVGAGVSGGVGAAPAAAHRQGRQGGGVVGGGAGGVRGASAGVAEAALRQMEAWMGVFGAPSLEEWWDGLGQEDGGRRG